MARSVLWEMTPDAEIVSVDFCKSIMYSVAALSYGEAQVRDVEPHVMFTCPIYVEPR
jgi:exosome complex exonuclease DIS3/RRP44